MTQIQPGEGRPSQAARWFLRLSLLLLVLHTLLFAYIWFNGLEASMRLNDMIRSTATLSETYSFSYWLSFTRGALIWVPLFLGHVFIHLLIVGRIKRPRDERRLYREGFRDGVVFERELREDSLRRAKRTLGEADALSLPLAYDNEDGELIDLETAAKRKRS
ncbi:MAG: hypothetical protein SNJ59_10745 [Aggregatilineales bacterium]